MGTLSFVLALLGIGASCAHYMFDMASQQVLKYGSGIAAAVLYVLALILSVKEMKKQKTDGGIKPSMKNMALMGHSAAGVALVFGGIICALAFIKNPIA